MATARKLITSSLRKIEVLASGETPEAAEAEDALEDLNSLISIWNLEGLRGDFTVMESFPVVAGGRIYTIGVGGDFNTARPEEIDYMFFLENNQEYNIIDLTLQRYNTFTNKEIISRPEGFYYSREYPLGKILFSSTMDKAYSLNIFSRKPLESFINLDDEINVDAGFEYALKYNLAIELAPEFGKKVTKEVEARAAHSKLMVSAVSIEPEESVSSLANRNTGNYDIQRGT